MQREREREREQRPNELNHSSSGDAAAGVVKLE